MPVSVTANATAAPGARRAPGDPAIQPRRHVPHAHRHVALRGELERVRQQVLQDLLQALRVGRERRAAAPGRSRRRSARLLVSATWRNVRCTRVAQRAERDLLGLDRHRARLDLREIEDVVDQRQQIGARRVDVLGEVDLLAGEVAADVVGELLAEDEDRVERRAQLVRHVREELGLVLRRERELRGLLLERAAGLLDLLVLALDLRVLLGELLRLRRELLVGLLQLVLPRLQLGGELLRLLQQVLGAHRRLDRVEHDADRLGQLIEEREVGVGERAQRRELDHRLRLALEQHRQHDDARRRRLAEARVDRACSRAGRR